MQPKKQPRPSTTPSSPQHELSRMSLTSTSIKNVNKYPKCQTKKQHSKQLLNLICLNQECKARGPICVMCRNADHATHFVMPVKKFLEIVQVCVEKGTGEKQEKNIMLPQPLALFQEMSSEQQKMASEPLPKPEPQPQPQKSLQIHQILLQKQKMLYALSTHITTIADQIRKIQQKIINDCEQAIEQAKNSMNLERNLNNILGELREDDCLDVGVYRARVMGLLGLVRFRSKDFCEINKEGTSKICDDVQTMCDNFLCNLQQWSSQSQKTLSKIFDHNPNTKKPESTTQKSQSNPSQYKFSSQLKIKSIQLSNENKSAKLNEKLPGLVIASGPVLKEKKIKLRICNLVNAIMVGVGFKDIIKQNNYKMNSSTIGHGTYMISNNLYTYSHHNKSNNMVMKGLSFTTGEQLTISLKGECITFLKKSQPKAASLVMKKLTEEQWKQLAICVFLGGVGDRVQFIE